MKQGRASREGAYGRKSEPMPKVVNPVKVAHFGTMQGDHATDGGDLGAKIEKLYGGAGFKKSSPPAQAIGPGGGRTVLRSGSQGKHK
jgi:hypothetical protein